MLAGFGDPPFAAMGDVLVDGADLCGEEVAYRFVASDEDEDPFFFWLTGTMHTEKLLQLRKCSADVDCENGGVVLKNVKPVAGGKFSLPLVRQKVRGLQEEVIETLTNDKITEISIEEFDNHINQQTVETPETDAE